MSQSGNYYTPPPGETQVSSIFGNLTPGEKPFLGGNPGALNTYLNGIQGQQQGLQTAAVNALNEPVAAPQANYGNANAFNQQAGHAYNLAQGAYGQAQGAYGQMGQATGLAAQAAAGNVPSQAALQQSAGISQAVRSQMAAAASTRGGAAQQAAAGQQAAMQGAQLQSQGINQAAQLRAQEMATARGQYLGATQAQTQAAQGQTAAQQGLAGFGLQQQAQAASQAQYQAGNQLQQNQLNNNMALGYGQQALGYGQLGLSAQQSQLAADTAFNQQLNQANQAGAQQSTSFVTGLIGAGGSALGALSDVRAKQNVQPVAPDAQASPPATVQPSADVALSQTPQPAAPPVSGMTKDQAMAFLKGQPYQSAPAPMGQQPMGQVAVQQPMMQPGAQPIVSDERAKTGSEATHVADEYLDHLARSASTYSYKDPSQAPAARPAGAKFGGVMAQDLQSVPEIGPQLVTDTPQGKTLEGGSNLTAALMGLGRLHERLKALEANRGSR